MEEDETDGRSSVATSPASSIREGTRVATAKRKLVLVNDAQVKNFTSTEVLCATCNETISLGEMEYGLAIWEQHKTTCLAFVTCLHDTVNDSPDDWRFL